MKITLEMLNGAAACERQVFLFKETFGEEAEVTRENCAKAAKVGLDFDWATDRLLPKPAREAYDAAEYRILRTFDAAMLSSYEACCAAKAEAFYLAATGEVK